MPALLQLMRSRDSHIIDAAPSSAHDLIVWCLSSDTTLHIRTPMPCAIVVLRGDVECTSREGRLQIEGRHWVTLDADSAPRIRSNRSAMAVVIGLPPRGGGEPQSPVPVAARGQLSLRQLRALRQACVGLGSGADVAPAGADTPLRELLAEFKPPARELARCPGRTATRRLQVYGRLQRARLFIEGHPEEIPRLASLAELTRFSPWYFSKAFTRVFGCNPQHLGKQVRLKHARCLLDSELSIGEIAAASGFENSSSFARAFHERFGASASALRSQLAGKHQPACSDRLP